MKPSIEELNKAIATLRDYCKGRNCTDCLYRTNCRTSPLSWEDIDDNIGNG